MENNTNNNVSIRLRKQRVKLMTRRRKSLLKKIEELNILCGVKTVIVIQDEQERNTFSWPSFTEANTALAKLMEMPKEEREKKMVTQHDYLEGKIERLTKEVEKLEAENSEREGKILLHGLAKGTVAIDSLNLTQFISLFNYCEKKRKELSEVIGHPDHSLAGPSGTAHVPDPTFGVEHQMDTPMPMVHVGTLTRSMNSEVEPQIDTPMVQASTGNISVQSIPNLFGEQSNEVPTGMNSLILMEHLNRIERLWNDDDTPNEKYEEVSQLEAALSTVLTGGNEVTPSHDVTNGNGNGGNNTGSSVILTSETDVVSSDFVPGDRLHTARFQNEVGPSTIVTGTIESDTTYTFELE